MPIRLSVTEFGFTVARVREGYYDAYKQALLKLRQQMQILPARRLELLQEYHHRATTLLQPVVSPEAMRNLRVSLIRPLDGTQSFRVENSCNMENDADDRLILSCRAAGAPEAFNERAPAYINFADIWSRGIPENMTKYEFALLRKTLNSAICLPIFPSARDWSEEASRNRAIPLGVVSIDSDGPLIQAFDDRATMQALATYSLALWAAL